MAASRSTAAPPSHGQCRALGTDDIELDHATGCIHRSEIASILIPVLVRRPCAPTSPHRRSVSHQRRPLGVLPVGQRAGAQYHVLIQVQNLLQLVGQPRLLEHRPADGVHARRLHLERRLDQELHPPHCLVPLGHSHCHPLLVYQLHLFHRSPVLDLHLAFELHLLPHHGGTEDWISSTPVFDARRRLKLIQDWLLDQNPEFLLKRSRSSEDDDGVEVRRFVITRAKAYSAEQGNVAAMMLGAGFRPHTVGAARRSFDQDQIIRSEGKMANGLP